MAATLRIVSDQSQSSREEIIAQAERLSSLFCRECCFNPLPYMRREFARYLVAGYAPDMLEEVIRRTSRAPRPSFAYLDAIMRNAYGRFTLIDFLHYGKKDYEARQREAAFDDAVDALSDEELNDILGRI